MPVYAGRSRDSRTRGDKHQQLYNQLLRLTMVFRVDFHPLKNPWFKINLSMSNLVFLTKFKVMAETKDMEELKVAGAETITQDMVMARVEYVKGPGLPKDLGWTAERKCLRSRMIVSTIQNPKGGFGVAGGMELGIIEGV